MKPKSSNPAAVALGRLGGSKTTEAQKASRAKNAVKARKRKAEIRAAKLYPSVYTHEGWVGHNQDYTVQANAEATPRKHTRTEVPFGKGVAKARKDGAM